MSGPFPGPAAAAINQVLRSAPRSLERLQRHAGRTVAFRVGPMGLAFTVQTTGEVAAAAPDAARDLEVRLSPFLLPRLIAHEEAALHDIEMQGDMELAQEVSFLFRHLTGDVEEDLSRVVGDIAAHRIVGAAKGVDAWVRDSALRAAQGASEYWTEESPLIASRVKVETFMQDVAELRDAVERLEKRIDRLDSAT